MAFYNIQRLLSKMSENNLNMVIAATRENILYFTGFESVIKTLNPYKGQCYALVTKDEANVIHLVIPLGEVDQIFDSNCKIGKIYTYGTFFREHHNKFTLTQQENKLKKIAQVEQYYLTAASALTSLIKDLKLSNEMVGYDEDGFLDETLFTLKNSLQHLSLIKSSKILRSIRQIKTQPEIEMLTTAARHNENAIQTVIKNIYAGISEFELKTIFETALIEQGSKPGITMLKIGRNSVFGQNKQRNDIFLKEGDTIWFDSDSVYEGYWSDIARVFAYKNLSDKYIKTYNALLQGQSHAIYEIKAGMSGNEIFQLTMDKVNSYSIEEYRRHHVGHGIGLEPYETPILAPSNTDVIENGMIINVETPYYEFGFGALHIEDPILVGGDGNIKLTLTDNNIIVLE